MNTRYFVLQLFMVCWVLGGAFVCAEDATTSIFNKMRAKAEKGDAIAQLQLGYAFQNSRSVPKDETEAAKWFGK